MSDFRVADISKQKAYDLLRDWIKLVARHTNPEQNTAELLGWLWKLKPTIPDPETGLVRCGCGEKAVTLVVRAVSVGYFAERICCKCHTKSTGFGVEAEDAVENVKNIWNTARGYKEGA